MWSSLLRLSERWSCGMRSDLSRGDIWWVDWSPGRGSEQTGRRPALVVQRDVANHNPNYPLTIVAAISTKRRGVSAHVPIQPSGGNGLVALSYVKCEQLVTISKHRLERRLGRVTASELAAVDAALRLVLDL